MFEIGLGCIVAAIAQAIKRNLPVEIPKKLVPVLLGLISIIVTIVYDFAIGLESPTAVIAFQIFATWAVAWLGYGCAEVCYNEKYCDEAKKQDSKKNKKA